MGLFKAFESLKKVGKIGAAAQKPGEYDARSRCHCLHEVVGRNRLAQWCGVCQAKTVPKNRAPLRSNRRQICICGAQEYNLACGLSVKDEFTLRIEAAVLCAYPVQSRSMFEGEVGSLDAAAGAAKVRGYAQCVPVISCRISTTCWRFGWYPIKTTEDFVGAWS